MGLVVIIIAWVVLPWWAALICKILVLWVVSQFDL